MYYVASRYSNAAMIIVNTMSSSICSTIIVVPLV